MTALEEAKYAFGVCCGRWGVVSKSWLDALMGVPRALQEVGEAMEEEGDQRLSQHQWYRARESAKTAQMYVAYLLQVIDEPWDPLVTSSDKVNELVTKIDDYYNYFFKPMSFDGLTRRKREQALGLDKTLIGKPVKKSFKKSLKKNFKVNKPNVAWSAARAEADATAAERASAMAEEAAAEALIIGDAFGEAAVAGDMEMAVEALNNVKFIMDSPDDNFDPPFLRWRRDAEVRRVGPAPRRGRGRSRGRSR